MRWPLALTFLLCACGFSGEEGEQPQQPDARLPPPCIPGFVDVCGQAAPDGNFIVSNAQINTDADARCRTVAQSGGPNICLFYFTDVEIQAGGTVLAHGSRPFALVATNEIRILGTVDVSSQRARPTLRGAGSNPSGLCTSVSVPEAAAGGGGGGAGGTFGTAGGKGGNGNLDGSDNSTADRAGGVPGTPLQAPALLRGGCDGQDGAPGDAPSGAAAGQGGGAVYLSAPRLTVSGQIRAGGSGGSPATGTDDGGSGGGSGGAIILESPMLTVSGRLIATGGGGGKGANDIFDGEGGDDGVDITPAAGGSDGGGGGPGGAGGTDAVGRDGTAANGGGGGGGGGAGFVVVLSAMLKTEGALMMPPAISRAK